MLVGYARVSTQDPAAVQSDWRILEINGLQAVTPEVVEAARQSLVIGPA